MAARPLHHPCRLPRRHAYSTDIGQVRPSATTQLPLARSRSPGCSPVVNSTPPASRAARMASVVACPPAQIATTGLKGLRVRNFFDPDNEPLPSGGDFSSGGRERSNALTAQYGRSGRQAGPDRALPALPVRICWKDGLTMEGGSTAFVITMIAI